MANGHFYGMIRVLNGKFWILEDYFEVIKQHPHLIKEFVTEIIVVLFFNPYICLLYSGTKETIRIVLESAPILTKTSRK